MTGKTLRQAGEDYGGDELPFWTAWEELYGLPDGYFVAGLICSTFAQRLTGEAVGPDHFIPYFRREVPPQTPAEARAIVRRHLDAIALRNAQKG